MQKLEIELRVLQILFLYFFKLVIQGEFLRFYEDDLERRKLRVQIQFGQGLYRQFKGEVVKMVLRWEVQGSELGRGIEIRIEGRWVVGVFGEFWLVNKVFGFFFFGLFCCESRGIKYYEFCFCLAVGRQWLYKLRFI